MNPAGAPQPRSESNVSEAWLRLVARCFALAIAADAVLVLAGWLLGKPWLTNFATPYAMAPNTAVAFLLAAISLWFAVPSGVPIALGRAVGLGCAWGVVLLGGVTGIQYVAGIDLHIDQLLAPDPSGHVRSAAPARMTPVTTLMMVMLGAALAASHLGRRNFARAIQPLAAWQFLIALVAFFGYAYAGESMQGVLLFRGIAVNTAVLFLLASLGLVCARPRDGVARVFLGSGVGGALARRMLPLAVLVPAALGWLRLEGQQAGYLDTEFGVALTVAATVGIFVGVLLLTARAMEGVDQHRLAAEEELRRSEERYRSLYEGVPLGLLRSAPDGRIYEANPAAVRLLGQGSLQSVLGMNAADFYANPQDRDRLVGLAQGSDFVTGFLMQLRSSEGKPKWVRSNSRIVRDPEGRVLYYESSLEDTTTLVQAQDELWELNANLEARVRERTRDLDAANRELEAFAYSVSHDLRAPLRAIDGFSQVLLEDYDSKLDDEGRDSLHRVRDASQRMAELIDALLALSRSTRGAVELGPVDLSSIAQSVADRLHRDAPERGASITVAPGVMAHGDERLLRTVLENLLANAWKYTGKTRGAQIEFGAKQENGEVICHVRDNGAGFDMAFVDKLFTPFQRLHAASEFPGNGVGLASVKRIVARLGGRVWAEAAVGRGASFYFSLPGASA
ncbi:MAG TPA: ATP-binding protein [Ramlibacter sp.]|nr:ATP-binding protein [Ramlibacter sp.]